MRSTYSKEDVEILLKDITGLVEPLPASVREKYIQSGTHYCEMLPLEYKPSEKYLAAYRNALTRYAGLTAEAVGNIADKLYKNKGRSLAIVSLARAGIPIGILIKRYIRARYGVEVDHYAISIIRGRGIDKNAMDYILSHHKPEDIQFVDGWIGKGAILKQLKEALLDYPEVSADLAVVSDPANLTELCGTHEDMLIASSCLNATVTGLISRTFLRDDIIGPGDFHGAAYYGELEAEDLSHQFLQCIEDCFVMEDSKSSEAEAATQSGTKEMNRTTAEASDKGSCVTNGPAIVKNIADCYGISDINFIKPGIGEATRVLLRRIPWKVIVNKRYAEAEELKHIYQLAKEKGVDCELSAVELGNYKVCGIIKALQDV